MKVRLGFVVLLLAGILTVSAGVPFSVFAQSQQSKQNLTLWEQVLDFFGLWQPPQGKTTRPFEYIPALLKQDSNSGAKAQGSNPSPLPSSLPPLPSLPSVQGAKTQVALVPPDPPSVLPATNSSLPPLPNPLAGGPPDTSHTSFLSGTFKFFSGVFSSIFSR